MATLRYKQVGWLDIAVNDAVRMRSIQRVGDIDGYIEQLLHLHRTAVNDVFKRRSF